MVIVKIWGGLGNQLFQYSFGKYLGYHLNTTVKYDVQTTNNLNSFTQRDLALSFFNTHIDIATEKEINEKRRSNHIQAARVKRKLAQQFPFLFASYIVEQNIPHPSASIPVKDNCYYEGYWQSYNYLLPVQNQLAKELTLKLPLPQQVTEILNGISNCFSVSIHVRRGDYLMHPHFYTCGLAYYEKAIAAIKALNPEARFYLFSDDIHWCRENFRGEEFVFVEGNKNHEDFYLMTHCRHNIIANSTFSWWAAWLNTNPGKIIIAPKYWHKKKDGKTNELLPNNWLLMS